MRNTPLKGLLPKEEKSPTKWVQFLSMAGGAGGGAAAGGAAAGGGAAAVRPGIADRDG